jgi:hypothetical protein
MILEETGIGRQKQRDTVWDVRERSTSVIGDAPFAPGNCDIGLTTRYVPG